MGSLKAVVDDIRSRVEGATWALLDARESVALALALALESGDIRDDAVQYLASPSNARALLQDPQVGVSAAELQCLLQRPNLSDSVDGGASILCNSVEFKAYEERACRALRCTLEEPQCAEAWERPLVRIAFFYAMHRDSEEHPVTDECVRLLGSFVEADRRRLEELQFEAQTSNDTPLLSSCILMQAMHAVEESA